MPEPLESGVREAEGGVLRVEGPLVQGSVVGVREQAEPLIEQKLAAAGTLVLDLSEVTRVDSSALSLVLHWMRRARANGAALELRNLPEQMRALARTSRMEQYLDG